MRTVPYAHSSSLNNKPRSHQLIHVRPLGLLILPIFLLQQHRQHLNRRLQPQPIGTLPPLHARYADTWPVLTREVEMTQDFLVQGEALLMDY